LEKSNARYLFSVVAFSCDFISQFGWYLSKQPPTSWPCKTRCPEATYPHDRIPIHHLNRKSLRRLIVPLPEIGVTWALRQQRKMEWIGVTWERDNELDQSACQQAIFHSSDFHAHRRGPSAPLKSLLGFRSRPPETQRLLHDNDKAPSSRAGWPIWEPPDQATADTGLSGNFRNRTPAWRACLHRLHISIRGPVFALNTVSVVSVVGYCAAFGMPLLPLLRP